MDGEDFAGVLVEGLDGVVGEGYVEEADRTVAAGG